MSVPNKAIIRCMQQLAPEHYMLVDDSGGLQIGSMTDTTKTVLVALELNGDVLEQAIAMGSRLVIVHHPPIYRPLAQLRWDNPSGELLRTCVRERISVYASHTQYDIATGGMNDLLANALNLQSTRFLEETHRSAMFKLVVYVPEVSLEVVEDAIYQAGAGQLGDYAKCGFRTTGTGTFMPLKGAHPHLGKVGQLEKVREIRLETLVTAERLDAVVNSMKEAHPYEEVAYDVFRTDQNLEKNGIGRIGYLQESITQGELANQVKQAFSVPHLRMTGDPDHKVQKIAIVGGSGRRYVKAALQANADVLITGDIDYHTAVDAQAAGLCLLDPGHHIEVIMQKAVTEQLNQLFVQRNLKVLAIEANKSADPFLTV